MEFLRAAASGCRPFVCPEPFAVLGSLAFSIAGLFAGLALVGHPRMGIPEARMGIVPLPFASRGLRD
jgi:hypothetical protein